jgi:dihydropteroate synthase
MIDDRALFKLSARRALELSQPRVMAILNVTPDSFSDGGAHPSVERALERAEAMIAQGADIIDVGGESTRPGAQPVSASEEIERVIPVIKSIRARHQIALSIDTSKPEVMRAAVAEGADLINDVRALSEPGALDCAAELNVAVCLMHMRGAPQTMQLSPHYVEVLEEVRRYLSERALAARMHGISEKQILIDPGFGFGKAREHNLALLGGLPRLAELGYPMLVGLSRKSMLGEITGRAVSDRLSASVSAAVLAMEQGAKILRVHDVSETVDAVKIWLAFQVGKKSVTVAEKKQDPMAQARALFGD